MSFIDEDLRSMQEARILMERAGYAKGILASYSQEKLDQAVNALAKQAKALAPELAAMSAKETGYGRAEDKYIKNLLACESLPERLAQITCVGSLSEDESQKLMEVGVPIGPAVALCPAVSPVSTALSNVLLSIKCGCPIVVIPHKRAVSTTDYMMSRLIETGAEAGLPEGAIGCLNTVTRAGALEAIRHKSTALVINTGVRELHEEAQACGRPYVYGGTGKSPVFIERTADVKQAVCDILDSRSFDYGITAAAEQYVVVDRLIADKVKVEMEENNAYFMSREEEEKLVKLLCLEQGISAKELACRAGFSVLENTRVLVSQQKYISGSNPFAKEIFCPVLAFYIEDDWIHACEKCMELLMEEGRGHTLVIHSRDEEVIRQFALKKPVGRVLVNTPATLGSMGVTTNLFPTMTLGSITAGAGITSENLCPGNFTYIRRVARGVEKAGTYLKRAKEVSFGPLDTPSVKGYHEDAKELFKQVLQELSRKLD